MGVSTLASRNSLMSRASIGIAECYFFVTFTFNESCGKTMCIAGFNQYCLR